MAKKTSTAPDISLSSTAFLDEENEDEESSSCSGDSRTCYENWPLFRKGTVWLPEFSVPQSYEKQMSFFNWRLLKERAHRQILLDAQRPKCGRYSMSRGEYVYKITKPRHVCGVYAMRFSPFSNEIVCGYGNGLIEAINIKSRLIQVVKERRPRSAPISSLVFHPSKDIIFSSTMSGVIYACPREKGKYSFEPMFKEQNHEIYSTDITINGSKLASVGRDGCVRIYDLESKVLEIFYNRFNLDCDILKTQTEEEASMGEGHWSSLFGVVFSKEEPDILVSGGKDSNIKIWDLRVPFIPVRTIHGPHIMGDSIDIMDGKLVSGQWTVGTDHLQVWDLRSTRLLKTIYSKNSLTGPGHYVHTVQFLKDEGRGDLILVGFNKGLGIISINESWVICKYSDDENIVSSDNIKGNIGYGGMNGVISLAKFHETYLDPLPSYEDFLHYNYSMHRFFSEEHLIHTIPATDNIVDISEHGEEGIEEADDISEMSDIPTPFTDTSFSEVSDVQL